MKKEKRIREKGEMTELEENINTKNDGKRKKIIAGIVIVVAAGVIVITVLLCVFIGLFLFGGPEERTEGADKYQETMYKYTQEVTGKVHTGFYCFPESIPESAFTGGKEPVFYFSYRDTWDDPTCEVYLECEYSNEDYEKELERLKGKVPSSPDDPKMDEYLKYEESGRFIHPVYIAIDRNSYSYEYAMDLGNKRIAYIYTSFMAKESELKKIPHEYLPDDYDKSMSDVGFGEGFNVYITERDAGLGAIAFDYDR